MLRPASTTAARVSKQTDGWELFLLRLRYKEGRLLDTSGSKPILLTDPTFAYLVYSGKVDVFAVRVAAGEPTGARTHLFRAEVGRVLLGIAPSDLGWGLLVSSAPGTQLLRVRMSRFIELTAEPEYSGIMAGLIDDWVSGTGGAFPLTMMPKDFTPLTVSGTPTEAAVTLETDATARPKRGVVWVKPEAGAAILPAGRADLPPLPMGQWTPLPASTWIAAGTAPASLRVTDTAGYFAADPAWTDLTAFHDRLLGAIAANAALGSSEETQRLNKKLLMETQTVGAALAQVVGVLGDAVPAPPPVSADDALLAACKRIGAVLDMPIRPAPPTGGTPVRDPLGAIAKASRVRVRQVGLRDRWWESDSGPLLSYREAPDGTPRQPVALLPAGASRYRLYDPATGTETPVTAAIAARLEPFAYTFYRPFPPGKLTPLVLLRYGFFGTGRDLALVLALGAAGGVISALIPLVMGTIFSTVVPAGARGDLLLFVFALLAASFASAIFQIVRGIALLRVEGRSDAGLQAAVWDRLLSLPARFFRDYSAGDLAERALSISQIRRMVSGPVLNSLLSGIFSVFNLVLLFSYGSTLGWTALLLVIGALAVTTFFGALQVRQQRQLYAVQGRISGVVLQFINGMPKFRVAGAENRAFAYWSRLFTQQRQITFTVRALANRLELFNAVYPVLTMIALFTVIVNAADTLNAGQFIAFNAAFGQFLGAVLGLGGAAISLLLAVPLYERARAILTAEPEVDESKADPGPLSGAIEVNHVSFRYRADGPLILDDISFQIEPGEFVALVGASGSGKSTLLRLLLGFDQPEAGVIAYDGADLTGLDVGAVRRQIGVVLQTGRLLAGDIFQNIVGATGLTIDAAWEAARLAGIDEDIRAMPMGMHTVVSEDGGTLSGGQRQRILIARSLVQRPRIIFFDEATSALDNRTQATVSASLDNLNATRLVIAHRLSTIMNADRIIVFERGRIVQQGTYTQLMAQRGPFAELARRQLK